MSICRVSKSSDPFARVDKRILSDSRLSWKAKGILSYLLGHPNDWEIRTEDLVRRSTDGRDSVLTAMSELRKHGYASFETVRVKGKIIQKRWDVRDVPETGFPDQAKPTQENPPYTKNKGTKKESPRKGPRVDFGLNGASHGPLKMSKVVKIFARFSIKKGWHKRMSRIVRGAEENGWGRATLVHWQKCYKALLSHVKDKGKILSTLRFFMDNYENDTYMPVARTFPSFAEKFEQIDRARRRKMKKEGKDDNEKRNPKGYWVNEKFIPSEEED